MAKAKAKVRQSGREKALSAIEGIVETLLNDKEILTAFLKKELTPGDMALEFEIKLADEIEMRDEQQNGLQYYNRRSKRRAELHRKGS